MYQARDDFLVEEIAGIADVFFVALHLGFIFLSLRDLTGHNIGIESKVEAGDVDSVLSFFEFLLNILSTFFSLLLGGSAIIVLFVPCVRITDLLGFLLLICLYHFR